MEIIDALKLITSAVMIISLVFVEGIVLFRLSYARPMSLAILFACALLLAPSHPDLAVLCGLLFATIAMLEHEQQHEDRAQN